MTLRNPYAAHLDYVRPARARADLWRLVCVALGFELAFVLTPVIIGALSPSQAATDAYHLAVTPVATMLQFYAFIIAGAALVLCLRLFHGRGLASLLGPVDHMRDHLMRVFVAVAIVLAVQEPLTLWLDRAAISQMRDIGQWAFWLLPAMGGLLIQVSTEELFFRGYLQQQLAARSASRWIWMGLPSLVFGLAHYGNAAGVVESVFWVIWTALLGMACADLTARTGNLGAAIGLHLANNTFALTIVSVAGWPGSGLALFLYPYEDPNAAVLPLASVIEPWALLQYALFGLSVFVMWMAARLTLRR